MTKAHVHPMQVHLQNAADIVVTAAKRLEVWLGIAAVAGGIAVYTLGYAELPTKVKGIDARVWTIKHETDATQGELEKFIAVQTEVAKETAQSIEAQKQLNVQQTAMLQQQIQLVSLLKSEEKKRNDS